MLTFDVNLGDLTNYHGCPTHYDLTSPVFAPYLYSIGTFRTPLYDFPKTVQASCGLCSDDPFCGAGNGKIAAPGSLLKYITMTKLA